MSQMLNGHSCTSLATHVSLVRRVVEAFSLEDVTKVTSACCEQTQKVSDGLLT